jgi:uncharacterized protein
LSFIVLIFSSPVFADAALPKPRGFVSDFANVMREGDIREIETLSAAVKEKTGAELSVVTIKTFAPYGSIEDFALALFSDWGIGRKGSDDGALLILAVDERKVKIEVGYGLEGAIPDSMAGRILDTAIIPDFRTDNFSGGLVKGASSIAAAIAKENGIELSDLNLSEKDIVNTQPGKTPGYMLFIIIAVYILFVIVSFKARKKGWRGRSGGMGGPTSFGGPGGRSGGYSGRNSGGHSGGGFSGGRSGGGGASRGF